MESKKVRFAPDDIIFYQTDWSNEDYTEARKGRWHYFALDRHRFQKRILETEKIIGYCFSRDHRDKSEHVCLRQLREGIKPQS